MAVRHAAYWPNRTITLPISYLTGATASPESGTVDPRLRNTKGRASGTRIHTEARLQPDFRTMYSSANEYQTTPVGLAAFVTLSHVYWLDHYACVLQQV